MSHQITVEQLCKDGNTVDTTIASSTNKRLIVRTNIKLKTVRFIVMSGVDKESYMTLDEAVEAYNEIS